MMIGWKNISNIARGIAAHARNIAFVGESPNAEWSGEVEVMEGRSGIIELRVSQSRKAKYTGKRWNTQVIHVAMSTEAWEHLKSVPYTTEFSKPNNMENNNAISV